jgi:hypothetical protein
LNVLLAEDMYNSNGENEQNSVIAKALKGYRQNMGAGNKRHTLNIPSNEFSLEKNIDPFQFYNRLTGNLDASKSQK